MKQSRFLTAGERLQIWKGLGQTQPKSEAYEKWKSIKAKRKMEEQIKEKELTEQELEVMIVKEYRASRQKNFDDERLVLELIAENKKLKLLNEELKKGI